MLLHLQMKQLKVKCVDLSLVLRPHPQGGKRVSQLRIAVWVTQASLMEVPVFGSGETHVIYGKIDAMP